MSERLEGNTLNCDEIDLFEIWSKLNLFFARYRYWILITPVVFMGFGLGLSKIPKPQWEATAILQVGRVSSGEFIEPLDSVIRRLGTDVFRESILKKSGISVDSPEAALYQNSLNVKQSKVVGMVDIKVRGFSKESALKLASATASEIRDVHMAMIPQALSGPKRRLAFIDKFNQDVATTLKASKQLSYENKSLADIAAFYFVFASEPLKSALLEQIDFPERHPTVVLDGSVGNNPVSPRKYIWIVYSGVLGLFLGILVPLGLNCIKVSNHVD